MLRTEKMAQIVTRKKKGRPSKADLARRAAAAAQENDVRRSRRRRNVRYTFDLDDFIEEDDEYEEEEEQRREKKLKLLLNESGTEFAPNRTRRVPHAPDSSSDGGGGERPLKKRKIDGDDGGDNGNEIDGDGEDEEVRRRNASFKVADSVPGTPTDPAVGLSLHEKKSLELILDKLQKKDTYGVYAEPVDPEELPDYHEVIVHPMDFATVRKKLGNGSYSTLEQFESDVYLICTNAMQYNAPDTIYHKQARSIQELAKKKFEALRIGDEHYEKELKSDLNAISNSLGRKQMKKPMGRTTQEPVGSDFSTHATAGDFHSGSNAMHDGGFERLANVDGPVVGNTSLVDNNRDKAEDLQGRAPLSRFGRKAFMHDENRRATYNVSNQPIVGSESTFTTFDGEIKQLVAVGIHADHSYARSLARFAATLGPVGWKVASRRIEEALPSGSEFGRGWVGDYESLPTPILMPENCSPKEPVFLTKFNSYSNATKDGKTSKSSLPIQEHPSSFSKSEGKSSLSGAAVTKPTLSPTVSAMVSAKEQSVTGANLEGKQPVNCSGKGTPGRSTTVTSASANYRQQSPCSRSNEPGKKVVKQVELNSPPISVNQDARSFVTEKHIANGLDVPASQSMDNVSRNRSLLPSLPFKQPENHGFVAGGLLNGKLLSNISDRNRMVVSSSDSIPKQMLAPATYFPNGPEQGRSDPLQLMRVLTENAQKQQKSSDQSPPGNPSSRGDYLNNASAAASRVWMSMRDAESKTAAENTGSRKNQILYNPARGLQPRVSPIQSDFPVAGMHIHPANSSFPLHAFVAPPVQMGNEAQFQTRQMNFPPSVVTDLSRFQIQSPWQGLNQQRQPRQTQESLPPDLNIGVQSSGSPVRQQPSGVLVDSQHPDLALQL